MRTFSKELRNSLITRVDIDRDPGLCPKEVIGALDRLDAIERARENGTGGKITGKEFVDLMFCVEGYFIVSSGWVGVRLDSSDAVKEEWMNYWKFKKSTLRD
ncbi:MAG: hypothetical protein LBP82_00830 [Candidatus Methanoplasma sp.]|jgi:hypothetical protein|nr:hypothetical protein [Candidatus Methanoplasma sp.]